MSDAGKHKHIIDLCSDDENFDQVGDGSKVVANPPKAATNSPSAGLVSQIQNVGDDNARSRKRRRTSMSHTRLVVVLEDENVEVSDLSSLIIGAAHTATPGGDTEGTAFASSMNSSTIFHIQQKDKWSCGFRNMQMILANLLSILPGEHEYFRNRPIQDGQVVEIPSLVQIQHLLEKAWQLGWDSNGAAHYQGKLVDKKVWIGAVEVSTALGLLGIDATIVQFMVCQESKALLFPFCKAYFGKKAVCSRCARKSSYDIVRETLSYIESPTQEACASKSCECLPIPLYLQWEGHSVTIIGVDKNETHGSAELLVLDPMKHGQQIFQNLQTGRTRIIRKSSTSLLSRNCQMIVCSTESISSHHKQRMQQTEHCVTAAAGAVRESIEQKASKRWNH